MTGTWCPWPGDSQHRLASNLGTQQPRLYTRSLARPSHGSFATESTRDSPCLNDVLKLASGRYIVGILTLSFALNSAQPPSVCWALSLQGSVGVHRKPLYGTAADRLLP